MCKSKTDETLLYTAKVYVASHTQTHIHNVNSVPEGCRQSCTQDNHMCTLIWYTHSSSLSLCLHPLKPEISFHSWGFSETCSPFHLIGHEKWMTNINSDCHYVCVTRVTRRRVRACVRWHLYMATGKRKPKVFYLFLSLIAEITVYFQTAPRCGELAWLSEHPHRTERDREINRGGKR